MFVAVLSRHQLLADVTNGEKSDKRALPKWQIAALQQDTTRVSSWQILTTSGAAGLFLLSCGERWACRRGAAGAGKVRRRGSLMLTWILLARASLIHADSSRQR
jgi:hypothetical protein